MALVRLEGAWGSASTALLLLLVLLVGKEEEEEEEGLSFKRRGGRVVDACTTSRRCGVHVGDA